MTLFRRLIRAALLSATLALLILTGGPSAFAKPAPPETPVGALVSDPAVSPPLSGGSAEISGTSSLWQLVLVAALSAVATVVLTLIAARVAAKHRAFAGLVAP